ncbi:sigma-54 interaction domain-containing protein [Clostridium scatologenes]|uniref:Transcriptional regulator n=1 Tax=Clostridium scatologenes TaxID=1548 RepID=A0A0E3JQ63_CLOSL|nr:sigma 54-interacting transcriptional regulator [Clostridium scatologenes]AKA70748.1 transcriptional regulator [Clostridium scatologenes]
MENMDLLNFNELLNGDEETLKLKIRSLYNIIECSYDGIYITDGQANTIFLNSAYEKITGMKKEEMLWKNMMDIEKCGYISKSATLMVLKSRKDITIEQKFKTGKKVMVSSNPIFDEQSNIVMVVTNVRDVTDLYELKEKLEKKENLAQKYYSQVEAMRRQLMNFSGIIAEDENMLKILTMCKKVSNVDTTVLLLGETGVGKEEISKYIHKNSKRSDKGFIKVNCGAIPENLIESELFGYEKGAFTGASKEGKIGLFELADSGTIFLDEVGELPLDMQVKLLRVLQEGEIKRVGAVKTIKVNVRVIAATNRNLELMVSKKTFREDLYYRLNVVPITIIPLRERKNDIEPLIVHFLNKFNKKYNFNKSITEGAMQQLKKYKWPGNVRELKNIIERVIIMSSDNKITRSELPIKGSNIDLNIHEKNCTLKEAIENLEIRLMKNAFEKHGNVRDAAKELGIDPSTFVRKRIKYNKKSTMQK